MILLSHRCLSPPQKPLSVTEKRGKMRGGWWLCWCWCVCVFGAGGGGRGQGISRVAFSSPLLALPILILTLFLLCSMVSLQSAFTHLASIYANLLEQKKAFTGEKSSTPTGFAGYTNMATVSLFSNTNMAAMTSCENTL